MMRECWYSASYMRDKIRLMHSPILGINFQLAYNLSLVSPWLLFSYLISLSLN
jgi:hypothetical protein